MSNIALIAALLTLSLQPAAAKLADNASHLLNRTYQRANSTSLTMSESVSKAIPYVGLVSLSGNLIRKTAVHTWDTRYRETNFGVSYVGTALEYKDGDPQMTSDAFDDVLSVHADDVMGNDVVFSAQTGKSSPQTETFSAQVETYSAKHETLSAQSETFLAQTEKSSAQTEKSSAQTEKFPAQTEAFSAQPRTFSVQTEKSPAHTTEAFSAQAETFSAQTEIFSVNTEKSSAQTLNLTRCGLRYVNPYTYTYFTVKDGDTLEAQYWFEKGTTRSLSCVLGMLPADDKFVTVALDEYTLKFQNNSCVGKLHESYVSLVLTDGQGTTHSSFPCKNPILQTMLNKKVVLYVDLNYYGHPIPENLSLSLTLRFHLTSTYQEAVFSHVTIAPHAGYLTNFLFDGRRFYSKYVDAYVMVGISHSQMVLISFSHFDVKCEDNFSLFTANLRDEILGTKYYPRGVSFHKNVLSRVWSFQWYVCGQWNAKYVRLYHASILVRFLTQKEVRSTGFKLIYSIHNITQAPSMLDSGMFNCSVPHYPTFQHHLACNLEVQCEGQEDEFGCPYSTDECGSGRIDAGSKCYKYYRVQHDITWYDAYDLCLLHGMTLVSPKSPSEWRTFKEILNFSTGSYRFHVGLRTGDLSLVHMYRDVLQWADKTMAFYNAARVRKHRLSKPMCFWVDALDVDFFRDTECGELQSLGSVLCEADKETSSREGIVGTVSTIAQPTNYEHERTDIVKCITGHYTKGFLACDLVSYCNAESYVTSCRTPTVGDVAMFICDRGEQTVSYTLVCDHRQHCSDGSDETFCVFAECPDRRCRDRHCVTSAQWCDGVRDCVDGTDEECPQFVTIPDSPRDLPPPAVVNLDGKGGYSLTPLNALEACPVTHFNCSDGYCMPVYLRCNGVVDCINEGDEVDCDSYTCPGFYRCRDSPVCVHVDHVCDGVFQCPQHDDELLCDLMCPMHCHCQGLAFVCTKPLPVNYRINTFLRYLDAPGSGMTPVDLKQNFYLVSLSLSSCGIQTLSKLSFPNLRNLDLSVNNLSFVNTESFAGCPNLRVLRLSDNPILFFMRSETLLEYKYVHSLDLSGTKIETLSSNMLAEFPYLQHLNLSRSSLRITERSFNSSRSLQVLDLRKTPLDEFPPDLLHQLHDLKTIYAGNYKLCCPASLPLRFNQKNCHALQDSIASCDDLLRSNAYRVCLWVMAVLALAGNSASLVTRLYVQRESSKTSFSLFVANLNVADLLMGVYLVIVGTADQVYRGVYLWQDKLWRRSAACKIAGFVSLLSSEMSAFIICHITLDRFLALRFVFSGFRFSKRSALLSCGLLWTVAFTLAIIPLLPVTSHWNFYSQNGICVPLPISKDAFKGRHYSFGVMIVLNMSLFLLIAVGQLLVYRSVKQNSLASNQQGSKDATIARRLITIVLSDFFCWFPIALLGLLSSRGTPISSEVNVFMAIFVLPLNSALNPFLYTLNIVLEKRRKAAEARLMEQLAKQMSSKRLLRNACTMTASRGFP